MAIVVESTSTTTGSGSSIVITKPSGLAVGDLLVSAILTFDAGARTIDTASGWTQSNTVTRLGNTGLSDMVGKIQAKIADSSDVAASNFTFTLSGSAAYIAGGLLRVSGVRPTGFTGVTDADTYDDATGTATISFTSSTTPTVDGSLVVMLFSGFVNGGAGVGSIGSYTTTPSLTWTELFDYGLDSGAQDPIFGAAYAVQATAAEITNYGATLSFSKRNHLGILSTYYPTVDASGTNALLSVSPTFFNQNGVAGTTGTNALLEVSPTMFDQSGKATAPTQWTPNAKPSTTWTPNNK